MKSKNILLTLLVLPLCMELRSQWDDLPGGNVITSTEWFGADVGSIIPLSLETREPLLPINFSTDATLRMQLLETRRSTINGFTLIKQNGFVGISPQPGFFSWPIQPGPFSRLHLVDSVDTNPGTYAQQYGYRPWMRNGITMTGNKDECYMGQKYAGTTDANDSSDVVIQWSDNEEDSAWPTDRLRFLFTGGYNQVSPKPYGANSLEGLESFRVYIPNDTDAFVGVGDFYRATVQNGGVMVDPTERLDVLDRTVRIRDLPTVPYRTDTCDRVVVVRADGRLNWRLATTITPSVTDCDWDLLSSASIVATAYNTTPSTTCPDNATAVGIGTATPTSKLHLLTSNFAKSTTIDNSTSASTTIGAEVKTVGGTTNNTGVDVSVTQGTSSGSSDNYGVYVHGTGNGGYRNWGMRVGLSGTTTRTHGVYAETDGATEVAFGGQFVCGDGANYTNGVGGIVRSGTLQSYGASGDNAANALLNYGVFGRVSGNTASKRYYAVYGEATNAGGVHTVGVFGKVPALTGAFTVGVWGTAPTDGAAMNSWAVYSQGEQLSTTGAPWQFSDATLKTNVEDVEDGLEKILQLTPKTYDFDVETFEHLHLPHGTQFGLIAQEAEVVIPELVRNMTHPAELDSLGNVVHPEMELKVIKYEGLIPLLIAAVKEQQAQIQQLQSDIAGCCSGPGEGGGQHMAPTGGTDENGALPTIGNDDLKIQPNPFSDATTISYTLAESGSVRLLVSTSSGKQLQVLEDVQRSAGNYTYEWNTTSLASGIYNVMLLLDGAPMVQKAVKIAR